MAKNPFGDLVIKVDLDSTGVAKSMTGLNRQIKSVNTEMRANLSQFDRAEKSIKKYETQISSLTKRETLQKEAVKQSREEYAKMVDVHGEGSAKAEAAATQVNKNVALYQETSKALGDLKSELVDFQKEQDIANSKWGQMSQSLEKHGDKWQSFGGKLSKAGSSITKVTAGIVASVAGIGVGLFAVTSKAAEAGDEIAKNATKLGTTTDFYQEMDYWAGQNGVSHDNFEKSMKRLNQRIGESRAGNEKYTKALTVLNVDMDALRDGTLTTEDAMSQSISTLSGMSNEQDKAALASELFGKKLGQELMPALQDGSLTMDEARKKAEELGIVIGQDQLEAAEDFQDAQDDMKRSMGMITTQIGLDLMPMFQKLTETVIDNLPRIKEIISNTVETITDKVTTVIKWFNALSPTIKKTALVFAGFAVAIGPILMIAGKFISIIGGIMKVLSPLAMAVAKAGGLFKMLGGALVFLTSPVGIVVGIIALLTAGFVIAYKRSETFRNFIHDLIDKFKEFGSSVVAFVQPAIDAVLGFFSDMKERINGFINNEGAGIMQAFQNIGNFIAIVVKGYFEVVKWYFNLIKQAIEFVMPAIQFIIDLVWNNIKGIIDGALNIIMGLVKVFSGLFTGDFSKMWEGIKQMFSGAVAIIWNNLQLMFIGRIIKAIGTFVKSIGTLISSMWKNVTDLFKKMKDGTVKLVVDMKDGIISKWNLIKDNVSKLASDMWTTVKTTFSDMVAGAKALPSQIADGIKNAAGSAVTAMKNMGNNMIGALESPINSMLGGVNWVTGKLGIKKKIPNVDLPRFAKGTTGSGHKGGLAVVKIMATLLRN